MMEDGSANNGMDTPTNVKKNVKMTKSKMSGTKNTTKSKMNVCRAAFLSCYKTFFVFVILKM